MLGLYGLYYFVRNSKKRGKATLSSRLPETSYTLERAKGAGRWVSRLFLSMPLRWRAWSHFGGAIANLVKRGVDDLFGHHLLRIVLVFARMKHRDYRHLVGRSAYRNTRDDHVVEVTRL
jgi:hypothetical protein